MKFIGVVFILCSTIFMGFHMSAGLKHKCRTLCQFQRCTQVLRNEIAFSGTPIPEIFKALTSESTGDINFIFDQLSSKMEQSKTLKASEALDAIIPSLHGSWLIPEFRCLTDKLGEYDVNAQLQGIDQVSLMLKAQLNDLEQERKQKGKLYESLGICTGLALTILLV